MQKTEEMQVLAITYAIKGLLYNDSNMPLEKLFSILEDFGFSRFEILHVVESIVSKGIKHKLQQELTA